MAHNAVSFKARCIHVKISIILGFPDVLGTTRATCFIWRVTAKSSCIAEAPTSFELIWYVSIVSEVQSDVVA